MNFNTEIVVIPSMDGPGGFLRGTFANDVIDLGTYFTEVIAGGPGAEATPGNGDDTVIGTVGDDLIYATAGSDVIDGGNGDDMVNFQLRAGLTGTLSHEFDTSGNLVVKLDTATIFTAVLNQDGSLTVTGSTNAQGFGTEELTGIESLSFTRQPVNGDTGSYFEIDVVEIVAVQPIL